jgi:hypothetical protein
MTDEIGSRRDRNCEQYLDKREEPMLSAATSILVPSHRRVFLENSRATWLGHAGRTVASTSYIFNRAQHTGISFLVTLIDTRGLTKAHQCPKSQERTSFHASNIHAPRSVFSESTITPLWLTDQIFHALLRTVSQESLRSERTNGRREPTARSSSSERKTLSFQSVGSSTSMAPLREVILSARS